MIRNSNKIITIVGGGNIGSSWALLFLLHGYRVSLYDRHREVHSKSKKSIVRGLKLFKKSYNLDSKKNQSNPLWDQLFWRFKGSITWYKLCHWSDKWKFGR